MEMVRRHYRDIKKFIVHCSDSDNPKHDTVEVIRKWHKQLGFADCGYHFFIRKNGEIQKGRELYFVGAHCAGQNQDSVGICLSGRSNFTDKQFKSAALLIHDLRELLEIRAEGGIWTNAVYPHNHFNKNKTCPNFDLDKIFSLTNPQLIDYVESDFWKR